MRVQLEEGDRQRTVEVSFKTPKRQKKDSAGNIQVCPTGVTLCFIKEVLADDTIPLASGIAKCCEKVAVVDMDKVDCVAGKIELKPGQFRLERADNFNYNTGRKVALKKALENGKFPYGVRKAIWEAYHEECGPLNAWDRKLKRTKMPLKDMPEVSTITDTDHLNAVSAKIAKFALAGLFGKGARNMALGVVEEATQEG